MMIMTTWQGVVTIIMAILGTILTRFLPFLGYSPNRRNRRVSSPIWARCCRTP